MMFARIRKPPVVVAALAVLLLAGCAEKRIGGGGTGGADTGDVPAARTEFVVAGDPGGGLDILGREVQQTLTTAGLTETSMNIQNVGGGSGNPAMAVAAEHPGTGDTLVFNSNRVYLNPITGNSEMRMGEDFVPVAQLMTEYVVLAVRADSPYQTGRQLMDALKADPRALTLGVGTVPSDDQLHLLRTAEAAGAAPGQLNIVAFSAGGDLMTQLLGGHVDAISSGLSEVLPQYAAGQVRVLAISAPQRVEGPGAEIPTWKEQGLDVTLEHWRGVFGPPDMPAAARDYWIDTFRKMSETPQWADVLRKNGWSGVFRGGDEFGAVLDQESATAQRLLTEVGLVGS
jgi:putative tricarboxylic transport membrane protein